MTTSTQRVAIIGGGITGLAAAERLISLDESLEVHLFEAGERLGGVLETEYADDCCLEQGPDSMLSRLPAGVDLCRRIGFSDELVSTRSSPSGVHVVCGGRLERVPDGLAIMAPQRIRPMLTTPILSWPAKLRMAADYWIPPRKSDADESLAAFIRRRLGREALERLVQPLAGGIYMGDPELLSIQATFPQFVQMEREYGSLIRAGRAARAKAAAAPEPGGPQYSLFVAPRRGMAQLVDALSDRLERCAIHRRQRVDSLLPSDDGGWQFEVEDCVTGDSWLQDFAGVIVAVPACQAAPLVAPAHVELGRLLSEIPYAGCVVVNLAYDRRDVPRPLESFGFVVPHVEDRWVMACTFSSLKYPDRAPDDTILFRAFLGGACFPEVLDWSDYRTLRTVEQELRELVGVTGSPRLTRIKRWRNSMPQYHVGHLDRVARIEALAATLSGLELAGNYFRGVGIPHCIRSGAEASERLVTTLCRQIRSPR